MRNRSSKLIILILLCTTITSIANPGMPPPGLPPVGNPVAATINQNIFILMGIGILFGLFCIVNKQKL